MSFIDEIEITVEGGKGGAGCVSFYREKYISKGGPDGGDGGKGGDVYIVADEKLSNLNRFLSQKYWKAEDGSPGKGKKQHGKDGSDLYIRVPVGTIIEENGQIIEELDYAGKIIQIAKGGKGGLGNVHFASATNQTPAYAQPGLKGEKRTIILNLKLIADVGFVGLPNAGKSTLLKTLTANQPKIADYPFTTISPNLGVLIYVDKDYKERRILFADIPGIIKGASKGMGLGLSFLKHIERVQVIVYILDIHSNRPEEDYKTLRMELMQYSKSLVKKSAMILFNKIDLIDYDEEWIRLLYEDFCKKVKQFQKDIEEIPVFFISAKEKSGFDIWISKLLNYFPEPTYAEILIQKKRK